MKKVKVANLHVETEYIDKRFFDNKFRKYEYDSFIKADMILKTIAANEITKPKGVVVEKIEDATIVRISDDRFCRYLCDSKTGRITCATYYNDAYSEVEIHLLQSKPQAAFTMTEFEYMYTGFAFSDRVTELGGAVLHGSSISFNNQGIIFSANSGTGKSTHTSLWKEHFGDKVTIVNDDKPVIRFYGKVPFMFGTPWSGKSNLNSNVQVPLRAIVFIRQSEKNSIERLSIRNSIFKLTSQISRPYYDEKIGMKTIESVEKLVQAVSIYSLHCNISHEAVDVVYNKLIKEEVLKV
jgi:hypothetical protein